jgi:hypothetical protein
MWVVIGSETINLERCNIIKPCTTPEGEDGTEFVFDNYSVVCNIPYDDVVGTVTRKHK